MLTRYKKSYTVICAFSHAQIQKVLSRGFQLGRFFLVDGGREDLNITKSGSSSADDGLTLNADLAAL